MPRIEFAGQSSRDDDNVQVSTARLVNCYRQSSSGGRSGMVVKSMLGTSGFADIEGVFLRGMEQVGGFVYIVHAGALKRISQSGSVLNLGPIDDDLDTFMSSNNGAVTIAANGAYWLYDGATITQPPNTAVGDVIDVAFMNQRTVLIGSGRLVQWSAVADPSTLDALDVATTEQEDDSNLRAFQIGGALNIFKETSIERWRSTATGFSFIPGGKIDRGLKSKRLAVEVPDGVFFVGNDNRAYVLAGAGLSRPVSTQAVETSIAQGVPTDCLYFADEGAEFYVIRFDDRPAWCFNIQTGEWNERADERFKPWSARAAVRAFGGFLVGTDLGGIYRLTRSNADVDAPLIRTIVSRSADMDGRRFRVPEFELRGLMGRSFLGRASAETLSTSGLVLDVGGGAGLLLEEVEPNPRPASVALEVSRDHGETWGAPKFRSMGDLGEYNTRAVYRSLGQFRSVTFRVTVSDAAELPIDAEGFFRVA